MNPTHKLFLSGLLLCSSSMALADEAPRFAGGSFAGNLTFASDYVFRGESETLDGDVPVVQAHSAGTMTPVGTPGYLLPTSSLPTPILR